MVVIGIRGEEVDEAEVGAIVVRWLCIYENHMSSFLFLYSVHACAIILLKYHSFHLINHFFFQ